MSSSPYTNESDSFGISAQGVGGGGGGGGGGVSEFYVRGTRLNAAFCASVEVRGVVPVVLVPVAC